MAERVIDAPVDEVPEIPEVLEHALVYSLDQAKAKLSAGESVVPFTALVVKDNLFIENHPGDSEDECFKLARHTVQHASGSNAYVLCYDGYVDLDDGTHDALIAEGGVPGADEGFAVGYLYTQAEDGSVSFEAEPVYIGPAPNFMFTLEAPGAHKEESESDAGAVGNEAAAGDGSEPANVEEPSFEAAESKLGEPSSDLR